MSKSAIVAIEGELNVPRGKTLIGVQRTLEDGGIEFNFTDGSLRPKQQHVVTLMGREGLLLFFDNVYETTRDGGGEILASGVEERKFETWLREADESHMERMAKLGNFRCRCLLREGDTYFSSSDYTEYRWTPSAQFKSVPFYIYGKKLAIIVLETSPMIVIHDQPLVTEAYRQQFNAMWDQAIVPST